MPRLPLVEIEPARSEEVKAAYGRARAEYGYVFPLIQTLAHSPRTLTNFLPFISELAGDHGHSVLPSRTKELVILKTSMTNACQY